MRPSLVLVCALASPAMADVDKVVADHILPAVARFAEETQTLADTALIDCSAPALRPAYQDTFDAWMGISHVHFGPLETDGRSLAIAFWPDPRGMVPKAVERLVATRDAAVDSETAFAEVSVAGRGLFTLEAMLYDDAQSGYGRGDYGCRLATALAIDLARTGRALNEGWHDYAPLLLTPGTAGNTAYLGERDAVQELYTALMTGLEFTKDQRIGRPMGTFERPRPTRAEAWRAGRPQRNVVLSLEALRGLAGTLAGRALPRTDAAFAAALAVAKALDDPDFAGVEDPAKRLKLEILQQKIAQIQQAASDEIGVALGVAAGFNSLDGD